MRDGVFERLGLSKHAVLAIDAHREQAVSRGRAVGRRGALRHLLPEELQPGVDLPDELGVAYAAKHDALEAHTLGAFELDRVALRRHEPSPGDLDRSVRLRRI